MQDPSTETVSPQELTESDDQPRISIVLNGKPVVLAAGSTISDFLRSRSLVDKLVVVELNGAIVARAAFPSTELRGGDRVEIVHFVGGG